MITLNSEVAQVTNDIETRSAPWRAVYDDRVLREYAKLTSAPARTRTGCPNQAHGNASCTAHEQQLLAEGEVQNIGIISSYNDMLSAHKPFEDFPDQIRAAALNFGGVAMVAGGTPAMCDGITQGYRGMQLSLFSRNIVQKAAMVGLAHEMFDKVAYLGGCDKIGPGLIMAALCYGHMPSIWMPGGPMKAKISNGEKGARRLERNDALKEFLQKKPSEEELKLFKAMQNPKGLQDEMEAYPEEGTCTFYGTAETIQLLLEVAGLQLPGSTFEHPNTDMRTALNWAATKRLLQLKTPVGQIFTAKTMVNCMVALLASGGSTNLRLHLPAIGAMSRIWIKDEDFDRLSKVTPRIMDVYPNGSGDINDFQKAGGMPFFMRELRDHGFFHNDVKTVVGDGLDRYCLQPNLREDADMKLLYAHEKAMKDAAQNQKLTQIMPPPVDMKSIIHWKTMPHECKKVTVPKLVDNVLQMVGIDVLQTVEKAFGDGGQMTVYGSVNGHQIKGIAKISSLKDHQRIIQGPLRVFDNPQDLQAASDNDEFKEECVVLVRYQGARANGIPELHKLTEPLESSMKKYKINMLLLTDGRLSGASKIPALIHCQPEAFVPGSPLAKMQDGDWVTVDMVKGIIRVGAEGQTIMARPDAEQKTDFDPIFAVFNDDRYNAGNPDQGCLSDNSWPFNRSAPQLQPKVRSQSGLQPTI